MERLIVNSCEKSKMDSILNKLMKSDALALLPKRQKR